MRNLTSFISVFQIATVAHQLFSSLVEIKKAVSRYLPNLKIISVSLIH